MPIWTSFSRCFRRKVIFGLIFAFLLMYCVLSLFRNEKKGLNSGNDFDEIDNMVIGYNSGDLLNEEDGEYDATKLFNRPLLWQMEVLSDVGNANSVELENVNTLNDNETFSKPCRNSVQGKSLIVDEKGYVCARHDILANGCCNTEALEQTEALSSSVPYLSKARYSCETCNAHGCCAVYEYCVSCCLDPKKVKKKKTLSSGQVHRENIKLKKKSDSLKLRLRSLDRFQICLAACRTSSASVQHENTYKNPYTKHCFLLQLPSSRLAQRHKRNSNSLSNNNNNDLRIAFTSFSAKIEENVLIVRFPSIRAAHYKTEKIFRGFPPIVFPNERLLVFDKNITNNPVVTWQNGINPNIMHRSYANLSSNHKKSLKKN